MTGWLKHHTWSPFLGCAEGLSWPRSRGERDERTRRNCHPFFALSLRKRLLYRETTQPIKMMVICFPLIFNPFFCLFSITIARFYYFAFLVMSCGSDKKIYLGELQGWWRGQGFPTSVLMHLASWVLRAQNHSAKKRNTSEETLIAQRMTYYMSSFFTLEKKGYPMLILYGYSHC